MKLYEKLGISEMKSFFSLCNGMLFDFCNNMNPRLCILFLVDKSMT